MQRATAAAANALRRVGSGTVSRNRRSRASTKSGGSVSASRRSPRRTRSTSRASPSGCPYERRRIRSCRSGRRRPAEAALGCQPGRVAQGHHSEQPRPRLVRAPVGGRCVPPAMTVSVEAGSCARRRVLEPSVERRHLLVCVDEEDELLCTSAGRAERHPGRTSPRPAPRAHSWVRAPARPRRGEPTEAPASASDLGEKLEQTVLPTPPGPCRYITENGRSRGPSTALRRARSRPTARRTALAGEQRGHHRATHGATTPRPPQLDGSRSCPAAQPMGRDAR